MSASIWNPGTPAGAAASTIPFSPTATLAATNVQAAIEETDTENRALLAAEIAALAATTGPNSLGFSWSTAYTANFIGWAVRLNRATYNVLQDIPVSEWANIAAGTSTTNLISYITSANTTAKAAGLPLFFPPGTYSATPTAAIEIGDWIGAGPNLSHIKFDCTSYSSSTSTVLQITGSTSIEQLHIYEANLAKKGRGLYLSASDTATFTGHQRISRVLIQGFARNLEINNLFIVTVEQSRFEYGTEGVYCAPADVAGDNGYVTTISFNLCWFASNTRNVYFNPAIVSRCILFNGGSIESATGAAEQGSFNNLVSLVFNSIYLEGASTIPVLRLTSVAQCVVNGAYMNGTGGIALGTNTEVDFRSLVATTSTDVLTGADGTQKINLTGCAFPSTGNSASYNWAVFNAYGSSYNGVTYPSYNRTLSCGFIDDTYSSSITINLRFGNHVRFTVNNGTAFTINAPVPGTNNSLIPGTTLEITLKNTSGGAMGAITWNAVFKLPTLTAPATGFNRTYSFLYDGTNWVFLRQTAADVPN